MAELCMHSVLINNSLQRVVKIGEGCTIEDYSAEYILEFSFMC